MNDLETCEAEVEKLRKLYGDSLFLTKPKKPVILDPGPCPAQTPPLPLPAPSLAPSLDPISQSATSQRAISQISEDFDTFSALAPGPKPPAPARPLPAAGNLAERAFDPLFGIDNLVEVWYMMFPETALHEWQKEELLRISGYVEGRVNGPRRHWFKGEAYRAAYVCANGSGKDRMLIATTAIGLPLLYRNTFVVITSSSHEQLKFQTQNHIVRGLEALHARLGFKVYESVEFYHSLKERGGEIKLFVTDEAGRAEGWHPLTEDGRLVIIVNEAKSIPTQIFGALDRCYGYSHWLEISSPGPRRGLFYNNFRNAIPHPRPYIQGEFFSRKVDYKQCPHLTEEEVNKVIRLHGENSYIVQTSLFANFYEQEEDVVIPIHLIESCESTFWQKGEIGIGLDCAAGNDETALIIRDGNRMIDSLFFRLKDTALAVDRIDEKLRPYASAPYKFNADDGGVSRAMIDQLARKGWNINRRLNQSAAYNKPQYLNLGAQMWFHSRLLFERRQIVSPPEPKLLAQLSTRKYDENKHLGKKALLSKKEIRASSSESPDRADAFVLAFFSHRPIQQSDPVPEPELRPGLLTLEELLSLSQRNPNYLNKLLDANQQPKTPGTYTILTQ